jgi:hypothetical protein
MQVEYHSEPGTPTALPDRDMMYKINKRCVLTLPDDVRDPKSGGGMAVKRPKSFSGRAGSEGDLWYLAWRSWGKAVASTRGVLGLPELTPDLHQPSMPASVKASRPRFCKRSGTIAYTRLNITGYGTPIRTWSNNAELRRLRNRVGQGKTHHYGVSKSIRRWCARPYDGYASAVG